MNAAPGAIAVVVHQMGVTEIGVGPRLLVFIACGHKIAATICTVLVAVAGQLAHGLSALHEPQALDAARGIQSGADVGATADDV
ncbi:hypothetical protein D9M72_548290 [compost metagenome]